MSDEGMAHNHLEECPNCEAPVGTCCEDWCRWCSQHPADTDLRTDTWATTDQWATGREREQG